MAPLGRGSKEALERVKPRATGRAGIEGVEGATGAQKRTENPRQRERGSRIPGATGAKGGQFQGRRWARRAETAPEDAEQEKAQDLAGDLESIWGWGWGAASWQWVKEDALFCKLGDDGKY